MPEPQSTPLPEIRERLQEIASLLRQSGSLDPETNRALAELVDELTRVVQPVTMPVAEVTHLAETTAQLADALHYQRDRGFLGKARDRLERAVNNAEDHAPTAVGLARRLLDVLANIGI
jgi:hypothetical protein